MKLSRNINTMESCHQTTKNYLVKSSEKQGAKDFPQARVWTRLT